MSILFNQIPGNIRVPFVRFEVNAGQAPYQSIQKLLLLGQKTALGSASAGVPILVTGGAQGLFGSKSMLANMYDIARKNAPFQEIWCVPLDDAADATAAAGMIAVAGIFPLTSADSIVLYVAGQRISVPVTTTMLSADVAGAIVDAVNGCVNGSFTAAVTTAGVKATASSVITGPATGAGVASVTINGATYSCPVANGDTAAAIAAKLAAAVNTAYGSVTATAAGATVTLTARSQGALQNAWTHSSSSTAAGVTVGDPAFSGGVAPVITLTATNKGTLHNSSRIETKLYSDDGDLADLKLVITQPSGGAGDPSITETIATLGDGQWDWVVMPYCNNAYLSEIETWLDAQWSPMYQQYGHCITAYAGSAGQVQAFSTARNSWHVSMMPVYNPVDPIFLWASAVGAQAAAHLQSAPELSRPLQTIKLVGIHPPKLLSDHWTTVQRQSFYYAGASGYRVQDGEVQIDRLITMYQDNAWGQPDASFLDINTIAQLQYGLRELMAYLTQTYPRCALVDKNPNKLQGFVTADDVRNGFVHAYKTLVAEGVFENAELFAELLVVERNISDPNRLDAYLPLDHVNQLRILAVNATSYLQLNTLS